MSRYLGVFSSLSIHDASYLTDLADLGDSEHLLSETDDIAVEIEGAQKPLPAQPSRRTEGLMCATMLVSGSLTSFFGGVFYKLPAASAPPAVSGVNSTTPLVDRLLDDQWITYVLTLGVFVFCAAGTAFNKQNWKALRKRGSRRFARQLLVPSVMDCAITALQILALAFTDPAIVIILKTASQLVVLAVTSRCVLKKGLTLNQWGSLGVVTAAVVVLALLDTWRSASGDEGGSAAQQDGGAAIGVLLAILSGVLGAWRNLLEAMILQDMDFPASALLLAESLLSASAWLLLLPLLAVLNPRNASSLRLLGTAFAHPAAVAVFALHNVASYGKDAGKFWFIKFGSPLRAKLISLIFPFGTWLISLSVYYAGGHAQTPHIGHGFEVPFSVVELLAFLVILVANVFFILKKGVASQLVAWIRSATGVGTGAVSVTAGPDRRNVRAVSATRGLHRRTSHGPAGSARG